LDATPLGEPLYRRFGFKGEYELVRAKSSRSTSRFSALTEARYWLPFTAARPIWLGQCTEVRHSGNIASEGLSFSENTASYGPEI
jgi:hypothetical protein